MVDGAKIAELIWLALPIGYLPGLRVVPPAAGVELREDGTRELREDTSLELRNA